MGFVRGLGPWICVVLIVVGVWRCHDRGHIERPPGVLVAEDPVQIELDDEPEILRGGFRLRPRAEFHAAVRILRREEYSRGALADLIPTDFAVGWGPMSDSDVLAGIDISQGNRFYYWYTESWPIDRRGIETHSANWHVIPADDSVRSALARLRPGSVVELRGRLVDIEGPENMRTSLSREDTGAGACEILFASSVRILEPGS